MENNLDSTCPVHNINTAAVVAGGLIGGWLTARETGCRTFGGLVLAACGSAAVKTWYDRAGAVPATALLATYVGAFAAAHPLAKHIGPWPAVLAVTTVASGAACMLSDLKKENN